MAIKINPWKYRVLNTHSDRRKGLFNIPGVGDAFLQENLCFSNNVNNQMLFDNCFILWLYYMWFLLLDSAGILCKHQTGALENSDMVLSIRIWPTMHIVWPLHFLHKKIIISLMVLAWKSWKVWAGTLEPVGPVCLDPPPPPPPPLFAPPPATRPGRAPPSLQKEEEPVELVEEPALSTGMAAFYYRQKEKTMLSLRSNLRFWWRCTGSGVRTLKLVSHYLPQVPHRCRLVHNIGFKTLVDINI